MKIRMCFDRRKRAACRRPACETVPMNLYFFISSFFVSPKAGALDPNHFSDELKNATDEYARAVRELNSK